jgi:uncharacterized DUF497 family protein
MALWPYAWYSLPMRSRFEWDPAKDAENRRKHGVGFVDAQLPFSMHVVSSLAIHRIANKSSATTALVALVTAF